MKTRTTDLTTGSIYKSILHFALPIFIGQIFQNLYSSVDSIVVGQFVGTTALAAVSSCADIALLLTGFFTGLSAGAGVLFAKFFGAKDYRNLHNSIHTAVAFSLILGVLMAILGIIATPLLLKIVGCPDEVYVEADLYLRIYFVGILFTALYNTGADILRSVGDSKSPFYHLVISSVINIVLDVISVTVFHMGVLGVACATIIAQAVSAFLVFGKLISTNDIYKLSLRDLKIDRKILRDVVKLGIPAAIQSSLIAVSNLFVQRYINSFGSAAMAGIGAAKKIDKFAGLMPQALALAVTTFISQNHGANKDHRAVKGIRVCLIMAFLCVGVVGTAAVIFAEKLVRIFTTDPMAIDYGIQMLHIMTPFYFFLALNSIFSSAVRGFGKSGTVMVLSLLGMIGCRQLWLAISMGIRHSVYNIFISFPLGWFFSALFVIIYYSRMRKQLLLDTES